MGVLLAKEIGHLPCIRAAPNPYSLVSVLYYYCLFSLCIKGGLEKR